MQQKVIDYEFKTIKFKTKPNTKRILSKKNQHHYSNWNLQEKISKISDFLNFELKLIGHSQNSYILGFFYSLVVGCLQKSKNNQQLFLKFKYLLYSLSQQFLPLQEQKIFVQNMCLLQYSQNIVSSLRKFFSLQDLVAQIFIRYKKKITDDNAFQMKKLQELKLYSGLFDFLSFQIVSQCVGSISISDNQFYIVEEKQIWFIMIKKQQNSKNNHKRYYNESFVKQGKDKQANKKNIQSKTNKTIAQYFISSSTPANSPKNIKNIPKFLSDHTNNNKCNQNKKKNMHSRNKIKRIPIQFLQILLKNTNNEFKEKQQVQLLQCIQQNPLQMINSERKPQKKKDLIQDMRKSILKQKQDRKQEENQIIYSPKLIQSKIRRDFLFNNLAKNKKLKQNSFQKKNRSRSIEQQINRQRSKDKQKNKSKSRSIDRQKNISKQRDKQKNISKEKYKIPKFILEKKRNRSFHQKRYIQKKQQQIRTSYSQIQKFKVIQDNSQRNHLSLGFISQKDLTKN